MEIEIRNEGTVSTQRVQVVANTRCYECGFPVTLTGQGRRGNETPLTGTCSREHEVFYYHMIR
jgi:hypothetical protein